VACAGAHLHVPYAQALSSGPRVPKRTDALLSSLHRCAWHVGGGGGGLLSTAALCHCNVCSCEMAPQAEAMQGKVCVECGRGGRG